MLSKICNAECFDRIIPEAAGSAFSFQCNF
jgi:hypothetical protein